jgi:transposase
MKQAPLILEDAENELPQLARAILYDAYRHLDALNQRMADTEHKISDNV